MAILGFILTYTAGTSNGVKDGMSRAMVFGLGLLTTYIFMGLYLVTMGKSFIGIKYASILAGVISILIGLNMIGVVNVPLKFDDYFKMSARRYVGTWTGLFFLGVLFSVVKVPCSAPFLLVLVNNMLTTGTLNNILLLLTFSTGILTPFLAIGLIGGYTLSERVRSYRTYIKMLSGVILVLLGVWMIV